MLSGTIPIVSNDAIQQIKESQWGKTHIDAKILYFQRLKHG